MQFSGDRREVRTWLLLVLALVPTASVLVGAAWLWNERRDEIAQYEAAMLPAETTHELFVANAAMVRAVSSLQMASLPGASSDVLNRADIDRSIAIEEIAATETDLVPLIEVLGARDDGLLQPQTVELMGGSIQLAADLFEDQVVGAEVDTPLAVLSGFARATAGGLVLPVDSPDQEAAYFFDTFGTTVEFHDQFDRDRSRIVAKLVNDESDVIDDAIASTELRASKWKDLTDTRTFVPLVSDIDWNATGPDPNTPSILLTTDPLSELIGNYGELTSVDERNNFLLELQRIDDRLTADVELAYGRFVGESEAYLDDLIRERWLTGLTSALMAVLGIALAWLTIAEVRRRRNVESAHGDALAQLAEKADRDPTTGVWNRRRLESSVRELIEMAPSVGETITLAYLDLDHFKAINDVWGHSTGDRVLLEVTDRLSNFTYEGIEFELCRFGGDEFVLFAQMPPKSLEWMEGLGKRIINSVDSEMKIDGRLHEVGASVGIATSSSESSFDSLLLEADSSLLLAKRERGVAVVYDRNVSRTGELVHAFPQAMANDEIAIHLQPVVDATTGRVHHAEALARWERPNGESVSPGTFIPLVESYGLAEQLTMSVLRRVREVVENENTPDSVGVWVNISPRELDVANFAERFAAILQQNRISPTRIGIEITESVAVRDPVRLAVQLRKLRGIGVTVAIDDFGSGYSPLGYLRDLPVDFVKLDRSLISNVDTDTPNQRIVLGIVGFVHELGMEIVAEGVERPEERDWLVDQGVRWIQGYFFGRPVPVPRFAWNADTVPVAANQAQLS